MNIRYLSRLLSPTVAFILPLAAIQLHGAQSEREKPTPRFSGQLPPNTPKTERVELTPEGFVADPFMLRPLYIADSNGRLVETKEGAAARLRNSAGLSAMRQELPSRTRTGAIVVEVSFSGSAADKARDGAILNVDGAQLGLRAPAAGDANQLTTLMAWNGTEWQPTPLTISYAGPQKPVSTPKLTVVIDYLTHSWSLYCDSAILALELPLQANGDTPLVQLSGVTADRPGALHQGRIYTLEATPGTKGSLRVSEVIGAQ